MCKHNEPVLFRLGIDMFLECCDCGLVHKIDYEIKDGKIILALDRNEERTDKARIKRNKKKSACDLLTEAIIRESEDPNSPLKVINKEKYALW